MARVLICKKTNLYVEIGDAEPTDELIEELRIKYRVGVAYSPTINSFSRPLIHNKNSKLRKR